MSKQQIPNAFYGTVQCVLIVKINEKIGQMKSVARMLPRIKMTIFITLNKRFRCIRVFSGKVPTVADVMPARA